MAKKKEELKETKETKEKEEIGLKSLSSGISVGGGNDAIVVSFQGGIGKHVVATSFIKWLNEKFPGKKIMTISAYPEVFEYNPRVFRNLTFNQPYLFEDYIRANDFRVGDPYQRFEYYRPENKMHVMKLYPKAYGYDEYNENPQPEIFFTPGEVEEARKIAFNGPPLITIQATGGVPPGQIYQRKLDQVQRDMLSPWMGTNIADFIVMEILKRGFRVLQVRGPSEPQLANTLQLQGRFRNMMALSSQSAGHVGIDSSMMHSAAVFKKPMLGFWSQTHADNLGYNYPGVYNKRREGAMYGRPAVSMPDNANVLPYRAPNEPGGLELHQGRNSPVCGRVHEVHPEFHLGQFPEKINSLSIKTAAGLVTGGCFIFPSKFFHCLIFCPQDVALSFFLPDFPDDFFSTENSRKPGLIRRRQPLRGRRVAGYHFLCTHFLGFPRVALPVGCQKDMDDEPAFFFAAAARLWKVTIPVFLIFKAFTPAVSSSSSRMAAALIVLSFPFS